MNPLWMIPAVVVSAVVGMAAHAGLVEDPMPCTPMMTGTWEFQFAPLDDEGYSEALGDLKRAGWRIVHNDGYHLKATCNIKDGA